MKRVMLVDDKDMSNFIMRKFLEIKAPDCEVFDFTDPEGAFAELDGINPDLIFLDINMPIMDGWDFLRKMAETNKHNKVAMVTSSTSEMDREQSSLYPNIVRYIVKPFQADDLVDVLESV